MLRRRGCIFLAAANLGEFYSVTIQTVGSVHSRLYVGYFFTAKIKGEEQSICGDFLTFQKGMELID